MQISIGKLITLTGAGAEISSATVADREELLVTDTEGEDLPHLVG